MALIDELKRLVQRTPNPDRLLKECERLRAELAELERQGLTEARPWWKDDKYLYLVYPTVDGRRQRKYIGKRHSRKAELALAKVERSRRYEHLQLRLAYLEQNLQDALDHLQNCQPLLD